jgi:hypothetical protein
MKTRHLLLLLAVLGHSPQAAAQDPATPQDWPATTQTARPWIRWWWPGNAVEPAQLSAQLHAFAEAGIGGVEITPIYGARGAESREIPYLSPRWVEMLAHVTREARGLGLGVDMATGTGWPFGGPGVAAEHGSSSLVLVDGRLTGKPTGMKVKRAAPGGEGLVLDPYSTRALDAYLERFTQALAPLPRGAVRSQFHDSFEYFNASWSPALPEVFRAMHGYDIQQYAAQIAGEQALDADTLGRIKGDYRRTLAKMHLDYLQRWKDWAHARGFQARNQAHGAPGALLDLYGASDIPETESFGASLIPSLRLEAAELSVDPDPPVNLIGRFASSAAHVMGRPLVSSETLTWLRENFRESPADAKPQLDRLFIAGINHIFYHGATYSPADAGWPGWYFYASTQLNPGNPLWRDYGAMHTYVARVQSVLQSGRPDNDVLLYWPEADFADDATGLMRQQGMHDNAWLVDSAGGRLALALQAAGYGFDFISDAQLQQLRVEQGRLVAPGGGRYRLIVVPAARRMPLETLEQLARLRAAAAPVVFEKLPRDVAGFAALPAKREKFARLVATLRADELGTDSLLNSPTALPGARREELAGQGLWFTRRASDEGFNYFLANYSPRAFDGWVTLSVAAQQATLLDPLDGTSGRAALRKAADGRARVYLRLAPGQSLLLKTHTSARTSAARAWHYPEPLTPLMLLRVSGIQFLSGGPELPPALRPGRFGSWTQNPEQPLLSRFSGTARYELEFHVDTRADEWWVDLGEVRESARVSLNGEYIGTAWSRPFRLRLGRAVKPGFNVLHVDVTNSPANRIRDLDLRKVDWKIMKEINLVNLRYRPFDASDWQPQPSGLLGPVFIVPMKHLRAGQLTSPSVP